MSRRERRQVPRPSAVRDDRTVTRGYCPRCGCPVAEVLFQLLRCAGRGCAAYCPGLPLSDAEARMVALWHWDRGVA